MPIPVLICDDSALARKQMARTLPKEWEVDITFANNGAEGIEAIKAGKGEVVFLDLNMPVMDGYEVLGHLRKDPKTCLLPVIALTAKAMVGDKQRCLDAGASDYLSKPVSLDVLLDKMSSYII